MNDMEGCKCKPAKSFAQRIIEYQEFVSLVRRMREAQAEHEILTAKVMYKRDKRIKISDVELGGLASATNMVVALEHEVDEYLKKMEE